jgi:hypothetical protein
VAIESADKETLAISKHIQKKERNTLVAERFLSGLLKEHGRHLFQLPVKLGIRMHTDF